MQADRDTELGVTVQHEEAGVGELGALCPPTCPPWVGSHARHGGRNGTHTRVGSGAAWTCVKGCPHPLVLCFFMTDARLA